MAVSISDINNIPDYTPEHMLKIWMKADADVGMYGVSHAVNGRTLTRANASEITAKIQFWQDQVNASDGGGIGLASFGSPR